MAEYELEFEKPLWELERKIRELEEFTSATSLDLSEEIEKMKERCAALMKQTYANLTPWQRVQLSRHPERPTTTDYINLMLDEFIELHGDRLFGDDKAIVCGLAKLGEEKIVLIGMRKGKSLKERVDCNFGCAHPEGYRKSHRVMKLAEKFRLPVVTLIDTPGAYPGIEAEERGQAWAIAENLIDMAGLKTPVVSVVIGEGGSGGALALAVADRLLIMENAYLSVISPEGCSAILWKDGSKVSQAAAALKLTAQDLRKHGIVYGIIPEPPGGAHRNHRETARNLKEAILTHLKELKDIPVEHLLRTRYENLRKIGVFIEGASTDSIPDTKHEDPSRG